MTQDIHFHSQHSAQCLLPLSFAQQRFWFLQQLEPANPCYNHLISLQLSGPLQVAALQHSLNEIIRRHEVLRTSFVLVGEQLTQLIAPPSSLPLPTLDLRACVEAEHAAQIQHLALQEVQRPLNLAYDLPFRACLLEFNSEEHVLLLTLHHIVYDRQSIEILDRKSTRLNSSHANNSYYDF